MKRKSLTVADKHAIIEEKENNPTLTMDQLAYKHGVAKSTISGILGPQRSKIKDALTKGTKSSKIMKFRKYSFEDVDRNHLKMLIEVFTSDDFVSSASASQIPVNDSRPDAEYDVPWTSAAAAAAAQAQATSQKAAAPAPVEPEQNFHRRGPLRSSNSTDEFSAAAAGRRRHKSGDFCNKKGFAGMSTKILFWLNLSVW